jgi:hypothetical protein
MKTPAIIFLLLACFFTEFIQAQGMRYEYSDRDEISIFSLGVQTQYAPFLGDNFLSGHYDHRPGYILETRFGLKDFVGFGAYLGKSRAEIKEPTILGNDFLAGKFRDTGFFLYYQYFFMERFGIEPQLGYAFLSIKHEGQGDSFKLNYQNAFVGLNGNFYITAKRDLVLFGGVRYARYFTNSIAIHEDDLAFVRTSQRLILQAGFRWEIFR